MRLHLVNGREKLNAKSIIAVSYLALGKEVGVHIVTNDVTSICAFKKAIEKWIVCKIHKSK